MALWELPWLTPYGDVSRQIPMSPKNSGFAEETRMDSTICQIQTTDAQIDRLVHQSYGLTEEEIKIVEGR
jgi:hypothetical protein